MNATTQSASLTDRSRALLAALVAFVLAVSGALVAAPAYAATATVNGSITAANEAGLAVTIDFTGVEELPAGKTGVYVALTESGTTNVVFPGQYVPAATIVGGAGSGSYTAPAANLDRSTSYEALVWFAHGNPTADVIVGRQSVAISGAQWDAVFGAEDDDESDGEGSGGDGEGSGDEGDSGEDGDSGEGDSGEGAEDGDGDSGEEGGAFTPVLSASLEDGTELSSGATVYKGDTVVVRGSGFDPEGNVSTRAPVTVGDPAGNYVVFGNFAEAWQPSTGAGSGDRAVAVQRWAMTDATFANIDARYINAVAGQRVTLGTDGSFEFSIELEGISGAAPEGGSYGVFTYVAGGATNDPAQELELRLDYVDSERPSPSITAELADGTELAEGATVYKNDTVVVRGSGFDPEGNISTRAPVTVGDPAGNYVVFGNFAEQWRPSSGAAGSQRSVGDQRWAMTDATFANIDARYINAVAGQRIVLTEDGTFEAELTAKAAAAAPGSYGVFTYVAGGAPNDPAQELELRLEYVDEERPSGPALEVFAADGVTPVGDSPLYEGDTVVVRGSGFDPEGNVSTRAPVTVGDPAGNYVVFGNFAEAWQPSTGAGSGDRAVAVQRWAMTDATFANIDARYINAVAGQRVTLGTDGSFEFSIELEGISGAAPEGGSYGVFTYVAGGATNDPAQELEVRLDYRGKAPATPTPELTVSPSSDLDPEAANVLTVTGTGFAGPGAANGAYILFGETSAWSGGAPLPSEGWIVQSWVPAALISDGAFTTTLTIPAGTLDPDKTYQVASSAAHGLSQTDRSLDAFAAVTVAQPATGPGQEGSLTWGFAPSFISYVEGPIAGGSVTVAAPATRAGGLFTFAQSLAGTSFDADKGTGAVAYAGSLRFTGHHGALDITVANPVITVTSATAGTLAVTSGGERVVLATLDLSKATRSASDGALTFTGAPATLTSAGLEKVFDGAAPTSGLAPVTFTVGVASVVVPPEPPTGPVGPKPPTTPTTPRRRRRPRARPSRAAPSAGRSRRASRATSPVPSPRARSRCRAVRRARAASSSSGRPPAAPLTRPPERARSRTSARCASPDTTACWTSRSATRGS
ncbi:HtaA domain-containing protein [Microbacterium sp. NIBRBAC000506063]|nr:HtaA domain-containing protein [Microbacterium sp. NIBRBAC000506063]